MSIRIRLRADERLCLKCGASFRPLVEVVAKGGGRYCSKKCGYAAVTTHGATAGLRGHKTAEYRAWRHMNSRCYNVNSQDYESYGGRGIQVCERWRSSFEQFLQDMGVKTSQIHSIDRKDNDGNYEPDNCRWATPIEQANNRRPARWRKKTAA